MRAGCRLETLCAGMWHSKRRASCRWECGKPAFSLGSSKCPVCLFWAGQLSPSPERRHKARRLDFGEPGGREEGEAWSLAVHNVDSPSSLCWYPGGWRLFHSFFHTFSHCAAAEGEDQFPAAENARESLRIRLLFKDFEVSYCLTLLTFTFGATQRLQLLSISSVVL